MVKEAVGDFGSTELKIPRKAADAFWTAVAVAPWAGVAYLDYENLAVSFVAKGRGRTPSHNVAMEFVEVGKRTAVLRVRAFRHPSSKRILSRDPIKERTLGKTIVDALDWDKNKWGTLRLETNYVAAERNMSFSLKPRSSRLRVNGVNIPTKRGEATIATAPGYYLLEYERLNAVEMASAPGDKPFENPRTLSSGVIHAEVTRLPSLLVFANTAAPPAPPKPPVIPKPPAVPGGAGTAGKVLGGVGRVAGRVFVVVGAILGAIEIGKAIKVTVEIVDVTIDNDRDRRSCCCTWNRLDHYQGPVVGPQGQMRQGMEVYNRVFSRTVVRPSASVPCRCGKPPVFPPTTVRSAELFTPLDLPLPGGAPTSGPCIIPGIPCPRTGFSQPFFREAVLLKGEYDVSRSLGKTMSK